MTSSDDLALGWLLSQEAAFVLQSSPPPSRVSLWCIYAINGPQGQWRVQTRSSFRSFLAVSKLRPFNKAESACPSASNNSLAEGIFLQSDSAELVQKFVDALLFRLESDMSSLAVSAGVPRREIVESSVRCAPIAPLCTFHGFLPSYLHDRESPHRSAPPCTVCSSSPALSGCYYGPNQGHVLVWQMREALRWQRRFPHIG
jgi:hypothetical protein